MPTEGVQNLINVLDQGVGRVFLRALILVVFIASLLAGHAVLQFRGFKDAAAMETAQLARNLARGQGYRTSCLRPFDISEQAQRHTTDPSLTAFPETRLAPVYPAVLAAGMALAYGPEELQALPAAKLERNVIVPIGLLFCLATGFMLFWATRQLFGNAPALVAVLAYVFTDSVLQSSISGTGIPVAGFLVMSAFALAVFAAGKPAGGRGSAARLAAVTGSAIFCSLAFLSSQALVVFVPAVGVFLWKALPEGRGRAVALFAAITVLACLPWLARNQAVTGSPFGHLPFAALEDSLLFPGDALQRSWEPDFPRAQVTRAIQMKLTDRLPVALDTSLRGLGGAWIAALFLVSFFGRDANDRQRVFRWSTALGIFLLVVAAALGNGEAMVLETAVPLITMLAVGFFFTFLDQVGFDELSWQNLLAGILLGLTVLPTAGRLLGSAPSGPYPPYHTPFVRAVCNRVDPESVLCSDIPWACAWYGNRTAILTPSSVDDFVALQRRLPSIRGLYLTQETASRAWSGARRDRALRTWQPILGGQLPPGFPFTNGIAFPPDTRAQVFLFDQPERVDGQENG